MSKPLLLCSRLAPLGLAGAGLLNVQGGERIPQIDGDWWSVTGNPDLGEFTDARQEPVDFALWQAADGTWQIWSCIRHTKCGGNTRLFHRWEGRRFDATPAARRPGSRW